MLQNNPAPRVGPATTQNHATEDDEEDVALRNQLAIEEAALAPGKKKFRKNKNTVARLLNILFTKATSLQREGLLANRMDLQFGELGQVGLISNQAWFIDCVKSFNDEDVNSGGLVTVRERYTSAEIDPEDPWLGVNLGERSELLTPLHAYEIWR